MALLNPAKIPTITPNIDLAMPTVIAPTVVSPKAPPIAPPVSPVVVVTDIVDSVTDNIGAVLDDDTAVPIAPALYYYLCIAVVITAAIYAAIADSICCNSWHSCGYSL